MPDLVRPKTVAEAVEILLRDLEPRDLKYVRELPEKKIPLQQFHLGLYIRNRFFYPPPNWELMCDIFGDSHHGSEDTGSIAVIRALWERLQQDEAPG